jgi:phage-related baseplate assembly protein
MTSAPTTVDLSRLAAPTAIEVIDPVAMKSAFLHRFLIAWDAERDRDASLPVFDVASLEANPASIFAKAWTYLRMMDRARVNDALRALLAPLATGSNLDALVARQNVQRLLVRPATADAAAIMETDAALLRRYLLSFDMASAGSADRYLYEAWTAWPEMIDARVNGRAVHRRRGDTDIVIIGPGGRLATAEEKAVVSAAVTAPHVRPEAVSVAVLDATRLEYAADLVIEVAPGPDATVVRDEAEKRVRDAGQARLLIGGEVPAGYLAAAAYGPNVIKVRDNAPVIIAPDPYTVPVLTEIRIHTEVRL